METKENYIDELVRNSLSRTGPSSDDAALWDRIDKTMKFKRFLRFSLNTFNIYYSVAILLIIFSAVYFFINNNSQNISPVNNNNSIQPAPSAKNDVQPELKNDKIGDPSASSIQPVSGQNIQDNSAKKSNTNSLTVIKKETENNISTTENTESKTTKKAKKVKVVKKQVVITDTIRKKETVIIKKPATPK